MLRRPLEITLTAVVAVMHHMLWPALSNRSLQGSQHELVTQVRLHGPADNLARPHIEYDRQIQKASPRRNIGDVSNPQLIWAAGLELPIDQIRREQRIDRAVNPHITLRHHALKPCSTHQACHAFAADVDLMIVRQLRMDHRRAIGAPRFTVDRMDLRAQRQIHPIAGRHRPLKPGIKAALGDLQQSAHLPYRVDGLVRLHESEERFGVAVLAFANPAVAFERISRSS
jgi:hypothetical protein